MTLSEEAKGTVSRLQQCTKYRQTCSWKDLKVTSDMRKAGACVSSFSCRLCRYRGAMSSAVKRRGAAVHTRECQPSIMDATAGSCLPSSELQQGCCYASSCCCCCLLLRRPLLTSFPCVAALRLLQRDAQLGYQQLKHVAPLLCTHGNMHRASTEQAQGGHRQAQRGCEHGAGGIRSRRAPEGDSAQRLLPPCCRHCSLPPPARPAPVYVCSLLATYGLNIMDS
jgi:hypothetical protein